MEKNNDRVLAYQLAKNLTHEELMAVSGGASQMQMTTKFSSQPSGGGAAGTHVEADVKMDF